MEIELNGNKINLTDEQFKEIVDKYGETSKRWKPWANEEYWFVDSCGYVEWDQWGDIGSSDLESDHWRYEQGNCFKTKEEAKMHLEYLNAVATLRNSSDFVPDNNDPSQEFYFIFYNKITGQLEYTSDDVYRYYNIVYYKTEKEARDSIKKYRKEWNIVFGIEG